MANKICETQRAHFSDRLDGEPLPLWRGWMVSMHLTICPQCRRYNRSLTATREALRALGQSEIDPPKK